jgi:hypothetical protein
MDFVKKNLGLLICAAVSFVLVCVLMFFMVKTAGQMKKVNNKVTEQMSFFSHVADQGYKLTAEKGAELENLLQAQKNFDEAEQFYRSSRDYLANNYSIKPELPLTSPDAIKLINEKIRQMTDFVLKNRIDFPGLAKEFSVIVARGSVNVSEFAPVFRQLLIYDYLVQKIAAAGIKSVHQLEWPLGFAVEEEDIYSITPIWLSINCELEVAQNFLNQVTNDKKMLFYIKNVTLLAPERYSPAVQSLRDSDAERARGAMSAGGFEAGGEFMPEPRATPSRRMPSAAGRTPGRLEQMPLSDSPAQSGRLVVPEPKRQDLLVFEEKYVALEVRLDLYEFKPLEER